MGFKMLALWALVAPSLLAPALSQNLPPFKSDGFVPNRFIIEVANQADIPTKRDLDAVYESLKARAVDFEVLAEFNEPNLLVGASVTLNSEEAVAEVQNIRGIVGVYPVRAFSRPNPKGSHVLTGPNDPQLPPGFNNAPHFVADVPKVHAKGVQGQGVKVAVIDSGIDYNHPNLGGAFGAGKKVIGGYDFVGDDYDGWTTPVPDDDPMDCFGHGTHVAGIIGASGPNAYNLLGVAPKASLLSYRVFGCEGGTAEDIIVAAMLRAVSDGAHIINLSLGGDVGWSDTFMSDLASRIADSGRVVVAAAGNSGAVGSWFASDPAAGASVISVGSVENLMSPFHKAQVTGVTIDGPRYGGLNPVPLTGTYDLYVPYPSTTGEDDACTGLPAGTPDLAGKVVIVRAGGCFLADKALAVAQAGASGILIYDTAEGARIGAAIQGLPGAVITAEDGELLITQISGGASAQISFPQGGEIVSLPSAVGGLMSSFSSYGPSYDGLPKPSISAPGGRIASTFPGGNFFIASGTSMASPFVAGSAALYLEAKGTTAANARSVKSAFEATARTIASAATANALPQTATQAGAGLVNVHDAIYGKFKVSPAHLMVGDLANLETRHRITITNTGSTAKTYRLGHTPAGTALTIKENSILPAIHPVPLSTRFATVTFSSKQLTIPAGQSRTVDFRITPPTGLSRSRIPVYTGFIEVTAGGGSETQKATYLGVAANMLDKKMLDDGVTEGTFPERLPAVMNSATQGVQQGPQNYTFVDADVPAVIYRLAFGTASLRVDLVAPNTQLPRRAIEEGSELEARQGGLHGGWGARGTRGGGSFNFPGRPGGGRNFGSIRVIGTMYEATSLPRDWEDPSAPAPSVSGFTFEEPVFANGTAVPRGAYKFLLRVLKNCGDPERQDHYESWLSPVVGFNYA